MSARAAAAARLALALAAAAALLLPAAPTRAASVSFGAAEASSAFNRGIDVSVRMTASPAPARVEVQVLSPGSIGPYVETLPGQAAAGATTLHYTLDTSGAGHLMPNTPLTFRFAAYPVGGGSPVLSAPLTFRYLDETQDWQTLADGIVTVHWTSGPRSFAQHAADVALSAIRSNATALGVAETEPVDFFIYADPSSFRAALGPGARENVGGEAITDIRTLFAEFTPDILGDAWVGITITHELTHQVVDDATANPYRSLPRWLNEGFAVYQSEGNTAKYRSMVSAAVSSGNLLPLTALGWQFPAEPAKTALAYAEAVSAVDYLARTHGVDALTRLILAYRDGPTDDGAMQAAIGETVSAFQAGWLGAIGAPVPSPFGPRAAPPGPLPSDWAAAASQAPGPPAASPAPATAPAATQVPPAPTATAPAAPGGEPGGGPLALVLVATMAVAAVLLGGLVVASRRAPRP